MLGDPEILSRFHPVSGGEEEHNEIRRMFIEVAFHLDKLENSRELSLALTALEEAHMWANRAVAVNRRLLKLKERELRELSEFKEKP